MGSRRNHCYRGKGQQQGWEASKSTGNIHVPQRVYTALAQNHLPPKLHLTDTICIDPAHSPPGPFSTPTHLHTPSSASLVSTGEQKHLPAAKRPPPTSAQDRFWLPAQSLGPILQTSKRPPFEARRYTWQLTESGEFCQNRGERRWECWRGGSGLRPHTVHCTPPPHSFPRHRKRRERPYPGASLLENLDAHLPNAPVHRKCSRPDMVVVEGAGTTWRACLLKPELIGFYSVFSCLPCPY